MLKFFISNFLKSASHQSCPLPGNQLSVRKHAVRPTFRVARSGEIIKRRMDCNTFFNFFSVGLTWLVSARQNRWTNLQKFQVVAEEKIEEKEAVRNKQSSSHNSSLDRKTVV